MQFWTGIRRPSRQSLIDRAPVLLAGFLGAVTAAGMILLLIVSAAIITYLAAREQDADFPTVAQAVLSRTPTVDLVGAVLLSAIVFGSFFCGGYVAGRLTSHEGRRQGLLVWIWALPVPAGLITVALFGDGLARRMVSAAAASSSTISVCLCLGVLGLLGASVGGDTGARAGVVVAAHEPAPVVLPEPAPPWADPAPVAAAVANTSR